VITRLFALRQMIGANVATALMACLLRHRLFATPRAIRGAFALLLIMLAAAGRFALRVLLAMLGLVASLFIHGRISFFVDRDIATPAMPKERDGDRTQQRLGDTVMFLRRGRELGA
jgi:hypothetical protein